MKVEKISSKALILLKYTEWLLVPFMMIPILALLSPEGLWGRPFDYWLLEVILIPVVPGVLVLLIVRQLLSSNDFRFKIVLHALVIMLATNTSSDYLGQIDFSGEGTPLLEVIMFGFLIFMLLGAVNNLLRLGEIYIKDLEILKEQIVEGNSSKIDNQHFLNDSLFGPFAHLINEIISSLQQIDDTIKTTTEDLHLVSDHIIDISDGISNSTIEEVAIVNQIAQDAYEQELLARKEKENISLLKSSIRETNVTIENTTTMLQTITRQIKILALNANIEAARAGEHGRGFSVVASNVRKLSDETKDRLDEITKVIEEMLGSLEVKVQKIEESFTELANKSVEFAKTSTDIVDLSSTQSNSISILSQAATELMVIAEKLKRLMVR